MKIATLLFTYNRSYHTEQVIKALSQNIVLPQKLYIFQDGIGECDICEWTKVNHLIRSIDWCDTEIFVSEHNKGLADAIVFGVNYAFQENDAVIVLEDDCVPTANFISFMQQCFEKYCFDKRVYSVSGYTWPIILEKGQYDIYGCGRISSWGWGTWKNRWEEAYKKDFELVKRMKREEVLSRNLAMWGSDLEDIVVKNVRGECDSWAVFWALNVISKEGICINPYKSFIKNIGMDGSGRHCGITNRFESRCIDEEQIEFCLPDKLDISEETKSAFAALYGSYTAAARSDESKERILIYGAGKFYLNNEKAINEKYVIEALIDKKKRGWMEGKRIISLNEAGQYIYDKILVMVWNIQECMNIIKELAAQGISQENILLGHSLFGNYDGTLDNIFISDNQGGADIDNGR